MQTLLLISLHQAAIWKNIVEYDPNIWQTVNVFPHWTRRYQTHVNFNRVLLVSPPVKRSGTDKAVWTLPFVSMLWVHTHPQQPFKKNFKLKSKTIAAPEIHSVSVKHRKPIFMEAKRNMTCLQTGRLRPHPICKWRTCCINIQAKCILLAV